MGTKRKRERSKHRRAREEAAQRHHALQLRAKLRRAVLGWIGCAAGFIASTAVLVWRMRLGTVDSGRNYFGMPVGPVLWSILGISLSVGFAIAIWQWNFAGPTKPRKGSRPGARPVDLTSWKKW